MAWGLPFRRVSRAHRRRTFRQLRRSRSEMCTLEIGRSADAQPCAPVHHDASFRSGQYESTPDTVGHEPTRCAMIFRGPYPDIAIPKTPLTPVVLRHATQLGDKPALIDGASGRVLTYGQLAG